MVSSKMNHLSCVGFYNMMTGCQEYSVVTAILYNFSPLVLPVVTMCHFSYDLNILLASLYLTFLTKHWDVLFCNIHLGIYNRISSRSFIAYKLWLCSAPHHDTAVKNLSLLSSFILPFIIHTHVFELVLCNTQIMFLINDRSWLI